MRKLQFAGFILAIAGICSILLDSPARAGGKSDTEVKVTAKASKIENGKQTITFTLAVNPGWYIYANPVGDEMLAPNATNIKIKGKGKVEFKVAYPTGKPKSDTIGKEVIKYSIYEDKIEIPVTITRGSGDTDPAEVSVFFSACNKKGICLQPATVKGICKDGETVELKGK